MQFCLINNYYKQVKMKYSSEIHRIGMTWGWINDNIFGWTVSLSGSGYNQVTHKLAIRLTDIFCEIQLKRNKEYPTANKSPYMYVQKKKQFEKKKKESCVDRWVICVWHECMISLNSRTLILFPLHSKYHAKSSEMMPGSSRGSQLCPFIRSPSKWEKRPTPHSTAQRGVCAVFS